MNFEQVARDTAKEIGFDSEKAGLNCHTCDVVQRIDRQAPEIADAVHLKKDKEEDLGAGDQGLMFGYATDEYDKKLLHPYSH